MILRRATLEDVDVLTACLVAAYAPYMHLGLPPVTEGVADDVAQSLPPAAATSGMPAAGRCSLLGRDVGAVVVAEAAGG